MDDYGHKVYRVFVGVEREDVDEPDARKQFETIMDNSEVAVFDNEQDAINLAVASKWASLYLATEGRGLTCRKS